ncbi:MAG: winged helix DNA-binding protein [Chloroflexi bacterium]|nr:winged helix DNA-binding protein [Chloroflexota bacterium]
MSDPAPISIPVDSDFALWMLLSQVSDIIAKARDSEVSPFGISAVQSAVMYAIKGMSGTATPSELSRWLLREPTSVSQLLIRMEKQGLIERVKKGKDRGTVTVGLTAKGEEAFQHQHEQRRVVHEIVSALSDEERVTIARLLEKLRSQGLKELVAKAHVPFPYISLVEG